MSEVTRILGIDPGSRVTGFGVLESDGYATRYIASGRIRVDGAELPARLELIFNRVGALVAEYRPQQVAVEKVFVHRNADSALKLGQARAAAICATFNAGIPLFEYAPRAIKQAIVGRGGADKVQVQHMVRTLLSLDELPGPDEADALAVAVCHAHTQPVAGRISGAAWPESAG